MKKLISAMTLVSITIPTLAQSTEVPMLYREIDSQVKANGHRIYQGVNISEKDGEMVINNTRTIFYEPKVAEVIGTDKEVSLGANCKAVENIVESEGLELETLGLYKEELSALRQEKLDLMALRRTERLLCRQNEDKVCVAAQMIKEDMDFVNEMIKEVSRETNDITKEYKTSIYNSELEAMATQFGGKLAAVVNNDGTTQGQVLKDMNPGYTFKSIQAKGVRFHLAVDKSDVSSEITRRTVLDIAPLNGQTGENGDRIKDNELLTGNGTTGFQVALSRIGACSDKHVRVARFTYDFDAYGFVRGYGMLNRSMLYKKISSTTSSGGLFSSETNSQISESVNDEQILKIHVYGDLSSEDAKEQTDLIKQHITSEALRSWTTMVSLSNGEAMPLPAMGETGAQVVADGLMTYCPHVYCQAGAVALKALNAIFGSSTQRMSVTKDWEQEVKIEYNYSTRNTYTGSASVAVSW